MCVWFVVSILVRLFIYITQLYCVFLLKEFYLIQRQAHAGIEIQFIKSNRKTQTGGKWNVQTFQSGKKIKTNRSKKKRSLRSYIQIAIWFFLSLRCLHNNNKYICALTSKTDFQRTEILNSFSFIFLDRTKTNK